MPKVLKDSSPELSKTCTPIRKRWINMLRSSHYLCTPNRQRRASYPPSKKPSSFVAFQSDAPSPHSSAVIITSMPSSESLPFCCHADLVCMTRDQLVDVADKLNRRLTHSQKIHVGKLRSERDIRKDIEERVGITVAVDIDQNIPIHAINAGKAGSVATLVPLHILPTPPPAPKVMRTRRQLIQQTLAPSSTMSARTACPSNDLASSPSFYRSKARQGRWSMINLTRRVDVAEEDGMEIERDNADDSLATQKRWTPQTQKTSTARSTSCPYPTLSARPNAAFSTSTRRSRPYHGRHMRQPAITSMDDLSWRIHTIPESPESSDLIAPDSDHLVVAQNLSTIAQIELDETLLPDSFSNLSVVDPGCTW